MITLDINAIRENNTDQTVYFTVNTGAKSYCWHCDMPIMPEAEAREYLIEHKDRFFRLLLGKIYPGADISPFKTEDNTELEAIQAWIKAGHKNIIRVGEDEDGNDITGEQVIEKREFKGTHPPWVKAEKLIDKIQDLDDVKSFLKKIVRYIT